MELDLPDSNFTASYHIVGSKGIAADNRIDLENVWGHCNLVAHGAGQALAQLDLSYGVDFEPYKVGRVAGQKCLESFLFHP